MASGYLVKTLFIMILEAENNNSNKPKYIDNFTFKKQLKKCLKFKN